MPTEQFIQLRDDPDIECERGPRGTLIFSDGEGFCVVGPDFVDTTVSDCYAYGSTREQALLNYALKMD
jgi:hypothetical protein